MVNVGLIGAGFMGRNHFNQYEKLTDRARIVALCDEDPARRSGDWSGVGGNIADAQGARRDLGGIRQYADWRELMADPDVDMVDLCVPTYLHARMTIAALNAGRHVLCEKPMALDAEECDKVLATAAGAEGLFMIAQCIRFWPEYIYLKQARDDGRFGALKALQLWRQASTPDYSKDNWLLDPALSGGAILDLHVHDVDFAIHLLGKPAAITAQACARPNGSFDRVHALWNYNGGPAVQIEGFWDIPFGFAFNCGFLAVFEQASLYWNLLAGRPLMIYRAGRDPEAPQLVSTDGYYNEIAYFLDCVASGRKPRTSTPAESRDAVAIALTEKKIGRQGQTISIT